MPRLVGRDAELARLSDAVSHPPALVLVEGEAGIGKSRLLREFLVAEDLRSLVAACPPFRQAMTLGPIVDAARQATVDVAALGLSGLAGALRPLFPEWAADLPPAPEILADAGAARHRLLRALAELIDRLAFDVLVVEDVHWADESTLDFLMFLVSRPVQRFAIVLTYRPEDVPAGSTLFRLSSRLSGGAGQARLTLRTLDVAATADLVSSMLDGDEVSDAFAAYLHERTDGVPLALEESVRLLRDRSDLLRLRGEWVRRTLRDIAVPATIRDAVIERVDRLGAPARQLLRTAAVFTEPVSAQVLAQVSGVGGDGPLEDALRSGLLVENATGEIGFRHVLAARAVRDQLTQPERRRLHAAAGATLAATRTPPIATLAYHFREAGSTDLWCRYAEQAADLARASGDYSTTLGFLDELLTGARLPAAEVARLAGKLPMFAVTGFVGRTGLVQTLRGVLADPRLDPVERATLRSQLGRILMHAGELAAGTAELAMALPDLADSPAEAATAMLTLAWPSGSSWPVDEHRRWLDRAAAVRQDPAQPLSFTVDRITVLLELGDEDGWTIADHLPTRVGSPEEESQLTRLALNTGDVAITWGRYDDARRRLRRAVDRSAEHGSPRLGDLAAATMAHLDWFTGVWAGLADRAARHAAVDQEPLIQLDAALIGALLAMVAGDQRRAEDTLRHVLDESVRRGITRLPLEPAAALAAMRLADGRAADAVTLTDDPMDVVTRKGIWLWATEIAPVRVAALLATDQVDHATALVAAFTAGLAGQDLPAPAAALAQCRALLAENSGPPADAAAEWAAAARAWAALPRPHAALLARERAARCRCAADDPAGPDELVDVSRGLSTLGATVDAQRVATMLAEHGVTSRPARRGGRPGYGDQLSPKELEVVRLVLTGRTNKQIADRLSRSPKTIAAQLNSAMRKYGASSRAGLAVIAMNAGITPAGEEN